MSKISNPVIHFNNVTWERETINYTIPFSPQGPMGDADSTTSLSKISLAVGLGKGKPYLASKIAKKKLGAKGFGKMSSINAALSSFAKTNAR